MKSYIAPSIKINYFSDFVETNGTTTEPMVASSFAARQLNDNMYTVQNVQGTTTVKISTMQTLLEFK